MNLHEKRYYLFEYLNVTQLSNHELNFTNLVVSIEAMSEIEIEIVLANIRNKITDSYREV